MKRCLTISCVLLLAAAPALGQGTYGWSISASAVVPNENFVPTSTAPFSIFLWYFCSWDDGMTAAEFDLAVPPGMLNLAFNPTNGFLNAGGASNLLLSVAACPRGPVVAGAWNMIGSTPGEFCLVNSAAHGIRVTMDCDPIEPHARSIDAKGLGYGLPASCAEKFSCLIATEPTSWGYVKSLYR